jgi:hypothetical protein
MRPVAAIERKKERRKERHVHYQLPRKLHVYNFKMSLSVNIEATATKIIGNAGMLPFSIPAQWNFTLSANF